jgi:hypothetical protein
MHLSTPPNNDRHVTPENGSGPREAAPELPLWVACVPFLSKGSNLCDKRLLLRAASRRGGHPIGYSSFLSKGSNLCDKRLLLRAASRRGGHPIGYLWRPSTVSRMPTAGSIMITSQRGLVPVHAPSRLPSCSLGRREAADDAGGSATTETGRTTCPASLTGQVSRDGRQGHGSIQRMPPDEASPATLHPGHGWNC